MQHKIIWKSLFLTFIISLDEVLSSTKCGLVPNQVFLKRGERKQLIFWTDQNYTATNENSEANNQGEQVDLLLQLVNGAMPKPEQIFNLQDEESYPQFQGVPSTSTTTTSTTSTTTTTTTKATTTGDTTTIDAVNVDTEILNDISTTSSSTTIPDELVDELTDGLSSNVDEIAETTLGNFVNDLEVTDSNLDDASPTTTEISNDSETTLPASTTLSTILDESEVDTITPLTISENEEEIVEIVEAVPSQLMVGPTPSIIMAEIVKPEDMDMHIHNKTDAVNNIQHESIADDISFITTQPSVVEQQEEDLEPGIMLETTTKEEESIDTTRGSTEAFLDESTTVTINPLLAETTEQEEESKTDVSEITGAGFTRTTISDGFHITVSRPIKQESKTEPPLDVIQNEDIDKSEVHINTIQGSGMHEIDEEKENSQSFAQSTTESIIDDTSTSLPVSDETITENLEISFTKTTSTTEKITTTDIANENIEVLLSIQNQTIEQGIDPTVNSSYTEEQDNTTSITTNVDTIHEEEDILDDDDYSEVNTIDNDVIDENEIQTSFVNNVIDEEGDIMTTTTANVDEDLKNTTDTDFSEPENTLSNTDTGMLSTEPATPVEAVEKEMTNEQNNFETNEELSTLNATNNNDEKKEEVVISLTTIKPQQESTTTTEPITTTTEYENETAKTDVNVNGILTSAALEKLNVTAELLTLNEVLFDDSDDESIVVDQQGSTTVPTTTPRESHEDISKGNITKQEDSIDLTTTTTSLDTEMVSITTPDVPVTYFEVTETSTIKMSSVDSNVAKEKESEPFVTLLTNTEANNIVVDGFEPLFEDLEELSNTVTLSQATSSSITTIPTTTFRVLVSSSEQATNIALESDETTELPNTRINLVDIIYPPKPNEEETYEFQDELETVNELNKTIHDLALALTNNENKTSDINIEDSSATADNISTLHNDAISHVNPLDTQNLENKVELIELNEPANTNDGTIKEEVVKEKLSRPVNNEEITTLASVSINNDSLNSIVETQTHLNISTPDSTTKAESNMTASSEEELLYDDDNDDTIDMPAKDTITNISILSSGDDMDTKNINNTTNLTSTNPMENDTSTMDKNNQTVSKNVIPAKISNIIRNTVFEETTTEAPIESKTEEIPLRIEAVVAELEEDALTITEQEIFDDTTTETPLQGLVNAKPLPIIIPNNIEEQALFETEAVISEERPVFILEEEKEFIYTTTLAPSTIIPVGSNSDEEDSVGESKFEIEALVAEEDYDNRNDDGTFIETTTVLLRSIIANKAGVSDPIKKDDTPYSQTLEYSKVDGPLGLETIKDTPDVDIALQPGVKTLEKLTRKEDLDVKGDDEFLDLQQLSEIDLTTIATTKPEKTDIKSPASFLTKFIDGFFVPKQKNKPKKKKKNPNKAFTSIRVIVEKESDDDSKDDIKDEDVDEPAKDTSFPVSEILSGIYKLVSNYVTSKPKVSSKDIEPTTTNSPTIDFQQPYLGPVNVHNMPRDQLIIEYLNEENSPSDPFFQMQSPNLRDDQNVNDQNIPSFPVKPNPPKAITLSPFNSPALRVQDPPKISNSIVAGPLPLNAPIERLSPSGFARDVSRPSTIDESAPPLPFLPGNFLRGGQPRKPTSLNTRPSQNNINLEGEPSQSAFLALRNSNQRTRDPINIPLLPDLISEDQEDASVFRRFSDIQQTDPVESVRNSDAKFVSFLEKQSTSFREAFLGPITYPQSSRSGRQLDLNEAEDTSLNNELDTSEEEDTSFSQGENTTVAEKEDVNALPLNSEGEDENLNCDWNIKTESDLYLLVTFHNLSAPFTVDCEGAYIEVERENNGFEARWCGNRVTQGGSRPHVIFAKNEVRISIFDDGSQGKDLPTGFSADVEVIDLFDGQQNSNLRRSNAYSNVRKLTG